MTRRKIVIVGGGFGGVKAALELSRDDRFRVILVSDRPNFQYYPTLYHTATGGLTAQSQIPLQAIFAGLPTKVVIDKAVTLDKRTRTLILESGKTIEYDDVVFGLGVVTNYFGIKGLKEFSFSVKSIEEIMRFKAHVHNQLLREQKPDMHYVIVGGGPTGIELAGALPSYLYRIMKNHDVRRRSVHVDLIEGAPRLLPRMPKHTSKAVRKRLRALGITLHLGKPVQGQTADTLMVGGKPIRSHTVVWTAGTDNNPFFTANNFGFGPRGKVGVNVYLQADDNVYVMGDNANTPYSGMAQTALSDGAFIADNLKRAVEGKDLRPYKPQKPMYVIPVGHYWAAAKVGKFQVMGWPGYLLRLAADARAFKELQPLLPATKQWFTEFGEQEDCTVCREAMATAKTQKMPIIGV